MDDGLFDGFCSECKAGMQALVRGYDEQNECHFTVYRCPACEKGASLYVNDDTDVIMRAE